MLEALRELPSRTMLVGGSVEKKRDPEKPNISLNPLFKKVINETKYLFIQLENCSGEYFKWVDLYGKWQHSFKGKY